MYAKYIKRPLDFILSFCAICVLCPILLVLIIVGLINMKGNPFFTQLRPGKDERIFRLIKFRTLTNEKDNAGNLLSDDIRLTKYGKFLRSTSLDELPELINILKGDMSIVGPRPQLVRDMVFMTDAQRFRHTVRPGLTGLAQSNGRNAISWENKLGFDLQYIENITLIGDIKIILNTVISVFKREGITEEDSASSTDLCDYLLSVNAIDENIYNEGQQKDIELIGKN